MAGAVKEAPPSKFWWVRRPKYMAIFLREATSFFILVYALLYQQILTEFHKGSAEYTRLLQSLRSPLFLGINLVILGFTLYHSITWLLLIPKFPGMRLGDVKIVGLKAFALNLALLLLTSVIAVGLILDPKLLPIRLLG